MKAHMMSDEDKMALKLKGYNCRIRFIDGEDIYASVDGVDTPDSRADWLTDVERKLNGYNLGDASEYSEDPIMTLPDIAIKLDQIKYIQLF